MNMIPLATNFRDDDKNFTLLDREGDVAILSYTMENGEGQQVHRGFEVVKIRKFADKTFSFKNKETGEVKETFSPAHEAMPAPSAWGDEGWSYSSEDRALAKFIALASSTGPSPVLGLPTGKPRGRARAEFELDLSSLTGEFEFNQLRLLFMDQDEPMLRNRLRAKVDAGEVKVVREISGGRGKPRKVYTVVK